MKTNNTHRLAVNKVFGAALLALGLSASLSSAADLMVGFPGRLSAEEAKSSLVPITTEAAMRNEKGEPIYDCLEPHISKFGDTWYAYGFTIREKDVFAATCYSSTDLKTWIFRAKYPVEMRGIPLWNVLYNAKNKEYVGYGEEYGDKIHVYTSPSPIGPFTYKKPMSAVLGGPGDLLMYPDTDGKAYLIYNKYQGEIPQRFAYIYQLTDDYYDIVPSTLCNTSKVIEGFWMIKRNGTYFLLGSGLVAYDVDDNFYLTASSPLGPWTDKGYIAPVGTKTFKSQTFQGLDVTGPKGTAYVFIGHRWKTQLGGLWANATSIWLPLKFTKDNLIEEMKWYENWVLDTEGATLVPPPPLSRANPQASSTVNGESAPANAINSDPATGWSSAGTSTAKSREFNALNYGAVGDDKTDNTEAFSACLKAVVAAGGGKMVLPDGVYRGQITIPPVSRPLPSWITIEIIGESEPAKVWGTVGAFPLQQNGTIIKSLATPCAAVISASPSPNSVFGAFSAVHVVLRNLDVRTCDNPDRDGIDLRHALQCKLENVFINTGVYNVQASKPTRDTKGLITPACNNAALTILRNVAVTGYHTGIVVNEHTDGDNIILGSNINGLEFVFAAHASRFGRVCAQRCTHAIAVTGKHGFSIEQLDIEIAGPGQTDSNNKWQATAYDINDPDNLGIADINYWVVEGNVGAVEKFTRNGGASIRARRIGSVPVGNK